MQVADFGIAKFKGATYISTQNTTAGTVMYMAPEIFNQSRVSEKCDVYAFALVLWESLTGKMPWESRHSVPMQVNFVYI